ncbi:MAG: hypothetical protein M3Z92_16195 [Bacteroidota bacterium]|nr:hypothetical protein [Bacteroidota bacterium]MDQ6890674.1 hypothetical protein [Bacteroidota bacterium]
MKKPILFFAFIIALYSCHSDNDMKYKDTDKKGTDKKEVKSENPVGIQNANGGIPDTVNTIDIGTKKNTLREHALDSTKNTNDRTK